ncbi:hypothetical protein [Niabella hirudinis]|uniref:hypothetical protein n=1 Tax=Niabella hirudinis TaxID=1285929 RepID=UPI003EBA58A1
MQITNLLKTKLVAIAALGIAITSVAFSAPGKKAEATKLVPVTFNYTPPSPGDFSHDAVVDRNNWSQGTASCPTGSDKACTLQVEPSHIDTNGKLKSDVTITAAEGSEADNYYVSGGTNLSSIQNKD